MTDVDEQPDVNVVLAQKVSAESWLVRSVIDSVAVRRFY